MIEPVQIVVKAEHEYPVHIGSGSIAHLATTLFGADKIAIIYQKALVDWVQIIGAQCLEQGASVLRIEVPEGELAKSTSVLEDCWQRLGEFKFTRSDLIIGVGGERSLTYPVSSLRPGYEGFEISTSLRHYWAWLTQPLGERLELTPRPART